MVLVLDGPDFEDENDGKGASRWVARSSLLGRASRALTPLIDVNVLVELGLRPRTNLTHQHLESVRHGRLRRPWHPSLAKLGDWDTGAEVLA